MLLYVESKAFPHKTFVVLVSSEDCVARVRAQLLHILYELGRDNHQFRLRHNGVYLRDAYTVADYKLVDNAIIKMVPMSKRQESLLDMRSTASDTPLDLGSGHGQLVQDSLAREVAVLNRREKWMYDFHGLLYLHFMALCFCILTTYWYSVFWTLLIYGFAIYFAPHFTRVSGFVGGSFINVRLFCVLYGIFCFLNMGAAAALSTLEWMRVIAHGCKNWEFVDDCSHQVVFSAFFYAVHTVMLLTSLIITILLLVNFKFKTGDYIERHLVKSRDIEEVMEAARHGKPKEKRVAAFELATLASSGDDNKFRIVAEGGLDVLVTLALSTDHAIQEYAAEALAELLTVPAIQDNFVEIGGVSTLTALLHASEPRVVFEALSALSYIVADSEQGIHAIVADHGFEDLAHTVHIDDVMIQRSVAGLFLELSFNTQIRTQMASMNTPAKAIISLCRSDDPETQRIALQALELLAIESSDMICAQGELIDILVDLPSRSMDQKLCLLAGKILLYFAEKPETCEDLLNADGIRDSLLRYAKTRDATLQKVVAKIIFCMLDAPETRDRAKELNLDIVLNYIRDQAADRDAWDMADQGLQLMSGHELNSLPTLSTVEKLKKMGSRSSLFKKDFGSRTSLGSSTSSKSFKKASDSVESTSHGETAKGI